jgi:hypothetical protein
VRAVPLTSSRAVTRVLAGIEIEIERDLGHQPIGRAIILAAGDGGMGGGGLNVEHEAGLVLGKVRGNNAGAGAACAR